MLSRQRSKESDGIDKPESGERLDCADVPESQMCKMKTCKITSVQYQLSSADALLQSVLAPHHSAVLMPASRLPELALPSLSTAAPRRDLALQTVKACCLPHDRSPCTQGCGTASCHGNDGYWSYVNHGRLRQQRGIVAGRTVSSRATA